MIEKLDELNRILLAASTIRGADGAVYEAALLDACRGSVIEGRMPDHEATLEFCIRLGFFMRTGEMLKISVAGENFVQLNPQGLYELHDDQRQLLVRTCYLGHPFGKQCRMVLKAFSPSSVRGTLRWSPTEGPELTESAWVIDHLCDLGVLQRVDDGLEVSKLMLLSVSQFVDEVDGLTEEKLKEILLDKEMVGAHAERMVLDYERERLKKLGHPVESACVRSISKVRVNAGFDIESFNAGSASKTYDRMIEVKGSGGPNLRFIWTENEQNVAKQLARRYWIYFQGGIDRKTGSSRYKPVAIQDPIRTLPTDARLTMTPHGLLVQGKVKGDRRN